MKQEKILVLGAGGQIGTELTMELRRVYGDSHVVATDIKNASEEVKNSGPFEVLDVMDFAKLDEVIKAHKITQIYHLVALLSATAEKNPVFGWNLNMNSLFGVMDLCVSNGVRKLFWPSSIAVFGPTTPVAQVPQHTIIEPVTVYGISKYAGELWADYYFQKKGLDIRSIRYPGLIGYKSIPGGGTTDYAVDIFYEAKKQQHYTCFLEAQTRLPMMYMTDAIDATLRLMDAPADQLSIRTAYNINGIDFTPAELATAIQVYMPDFKIDYQPDFRQKIANSWPGSIDGSLAEKDWGWKPNYNLDKMVKEMLDNVKVV
jgi:nucleoside-diphosphate-sugar epimerase